MAADCMYSPFSETDRATVGSYLVLHLGSDLVCQQFVSAWPHRLWDSGVCGAISGLSLASGIRCLRVFVCVLQETACSATKNEDIVGTNLSRRMAKTFIPHRP